MIRPVHKHEIARLFPPDVRDTLIRAAHVNPHIPQGVDWERTLAVNRAIETAKYRCPHLFR